MVEVMREGLPGVTMTAAVKDELSRIDLTRSCCRRAEVSTLLRFAGGLHVVAGRIVTAAELDAGSTAKRLRTAIGEFYGYPSTVRVLTAGACARACVTSCGWPPMVRPSPAGPGPNTAAPRTGWPPSTTPTNGVPR